MLQVTVENLKKEINAFWKYDYQTTGFMMSAI